MISLVLLLLLSGVLFGDRCRSQATYTSSRPSETFSWADAAARPGIQPIPRLSRRPEPSLPGAVDLSRLLPAQNSSGRVCESSKNSV